MLPRNLYFILTIGIIITLGLGLRLMHYDSIPSFNETADEFMYPWAGMSLLQTGVPTSWSRVGSYRNKEMVKYWNKSYPLVTPWVHKPLLYPLVTGSLMMINGATEFHEVQLSKLRLIPITLTTLTVLLIAIYGSLAFNKTVGIVAALLYATIPTIVISGRLSLTENAMVPLTMLVLLICSTKIKYIPTYSHPYLLGIIAATAILLKQTGLFIAIACILYFLLKRHFKESMIVASISLIGVWAYVGIGWGYVGITQFINLNTGLATYHTGGLPQLISSLFQYPMITNPHLSFMDPFILAGYILLFSAPWWLSQVKSERPVLNHHMLLLLPFSYLLVMLMAESGSSAIYGWHFFPLFPFISILLAVIWHTLYTKGTFLQILGAFLLLSPTVAWLLTIFPLFKPHWQIVMGLIIVLTLIIGYNQKKLRQVGLILALLILVSINVSIIYKAPNFLASGKQPSEAHTEF